MTNEELDVLLASGKQMVFIPPAMPESEYIDHLKRFIEQQAQEINRLRTRVADLIDENMDLRRFG